MRAGDSIGELRWRIFIDVLQSRTHRLPVGGHAQIGLKQGQHRLEAGFGQQRCATFAMIDDCRHRTAQRQRQRQAACRQRQAQARFDFAGQFVAEIEQPAAMERQVIRSGRRCLARCPPVLVEHIEEVATQDDAMAIAHLAIAIELQGLLRKRGQHIEACRRRAVGNTFEQAGIALRMPCRQRQQVEPAGELAPRRQRRGHPTRAQRLRNTRVPLVPPKPKPLETATEIFFSRATFGT